MSGSGIRRVLLGSFDLFHLGHLGQLQDLGTSGDRVVVGVLSDEAVLSMWGSTPFVPQGERAEIIERVRVVDEVFVTGPGQGWAVPEHDELFVDIAFVPAFRAVRRDLTIREIGQHTDRLPAHPALQKVLTKPLSNAIVA